MDLLKLTSAQLKSCLQELHDKTSGNKNEMQIRLQKHDPEKLKEAILKVVGGQVQEESLLDLSSVMESGEDPVVKLQGQVAALTTTVEMLVKYLQNVFSGTQHSNTAAVPSSLPSASCLNAAAASSSLPLAGTSVFTVAQNSNVAAVLSQLPLASSSNLAAVSSSLPLAGANSPSGAQNFNVAAVPSSLPLARCLNNAAVSSSLPLAGTSAFTVAQNPNVAAVLSPLPLASSSNVAAVSSSLPSAIVDNAYYLNGSSNHHEIAGRHSTLTAGTTVSAQDIVKMIPEFSPCVGMTSATFIHRINQFRRAYAWNDQILLYAMYDKLKGPARQWIHVMPIFQCWSDFERDFLEDFPSETDSAQLNMKMMRK